MIQLRIARAKDVLTLKTLISEGQGVSILASVPVYDIFEGEPSAVVQQLFRVRTVQNALMRSSSSIPSRGGGKA
jgi:hypothetical protein